MKSLSFCQEFARRSQDLAVLTLNNYSVFLSQTGQPKRALEIMGKVFGILAKETQAHSKYYYEGEEKVCVQSGAGYIKSCLNLTAIYNSLGEHEKACKIANLGVGAAIIDLK